MRAHSPLSGSSVNESCAQDTEQQHGKHGSGALLSSFPVLLVVGVSAEHGGCLSSVDRDRGLRIWSEREARRNESLLVDVGTSEEPRYWSHSEVADCPWLLVVTLKSKTGQIL